jgi:hypothetical protein
MPDDPHQQRLTAWQLYQAQAAKVDDRKVLLDRRTQFTDETKGGAMALSDELAAAALRATPIYNEFQTSAPSPLAAEDGRSYRLRIIDELKKHSSRHGNLSLRAIADLMRTHSAPLKVKCSVTHLK